MMTNAALNESTSDKSFMPPREILCCYKRSRDYPTLSSSGQLYHKILCMYWQLLANYNEVSSQKGKLNETIKVNPFITRRNEEMGKQAGFTELKSQRKILSAHRKLPINPLYQQLLQPNHSWRQPQLGNTAIPRCCYRHLKTHPAQKTWVSRTVQIKCSTVTSLKQTILHSTFSSADRPINEALMIHCAIYT